MNMTALQMQIQGRSCKEIKPGVILKRITDGEFLTLAYFKQDIQPDIVASSIAMIDEKGHVHSSIPGGYINFGKPIDYGWLCWLLTNDTELNTRQGDIATWKYLQDYMDRHRETFTQTVLERPVEFQKIVLLFLETLPDNYLSA